MCYVIRVHVDMRGIMSSIPASMLCYSCTRMTGETLYYMLCYSCTRGQEMHYIICYVTRVHV